MHRNSQSTGCYGAVLFGWLVMMECSQYSIATYGGKEVDRGSGGSGGPCASGDIHVVIVSYRGSCACSYSQFRGCYGWRSEGGCVLLVKL